MKTCTKCKIEKPITSFYKGHSACKECVIARVSRWYYNGNQVLVKRNNLRHKYGMTLSDYDNLLRIQGGLCAICGRPDERRCLHVDHDHDTGVIRGLLCEHCNAGLGRFKDNSVLLERAAEYIKKASLSERVDRANKSANELLTEFLNETNS
jgi:Recombination endonuclease VII